MFISVCVIGLAQSGSGCAWEGVGTIAVQAAIARLRAIVICRKVGRIIGRNFVESVWKSRGLKLTDDGHSSDYG